MSLPHKRFKPVVSLREIVREFGGRYPTEVIAGKKGLKNPVTDPQLHFMGLTLTGSTEGLYPGRIQLLGEDEVDYLRRVSQARSRKTLRKICRQVTTGFWLSSALKCPPLLLETAQDFNLSAIQSELSTSDLLRELGRRLEEMLSPNISVHGTLVEVFGIGVLLIGKSGIGKSECALALIPRGHKLITDDVVDITCRGSDLIGKGSPLIRHHMEIRGLGIINVRDMFGTVAVRDSHRVELIIELQEWDPEVHYDRLGFQEQVYTLMGRPVPHLVLPVRPARNIPVIVEAAARNFLLKRSGTYSARALDQQLKELLTPPRREKE